MERKKLSTFQWAVIIVTAILIVTNIILIGVIIDLKIKTENLKNKNNEISNTSVDFDYDDLQKTYLAEIYSNSL